MSRSLAIIALTVSLSISGCGARNAAIVEAASQWWQATVTTIPPEKAGTVTPAHEIRTKSGKVYKIKRHVQTRAEELDQLEDQRWANRLRAMVRGFGAEGNTLLVMTNLAPDHTKDAHELCRMAGGFIWSRDMRHFGLENVTVTGVRNERLSYRIGLNGGVQ
jgi:hypothetical protein